MKHLTLFTIFFLEACGASPRNIQTDSADASAPQPVHELAAEPIATAAAARADDIAEKMRDTNRILEECVMPSVGLYPRRGVCDFPPTSCQEGDL